MGLKEAFGIGNVVMEEAESPDQRSSPVEDVEDDQEVEEQQEEKGEKRNVEEAEEEQHEDEPKSNEVSAQNEESISSDPATVTTADTQSVGTSEEEPNILQKLQYACCGIEIAPGL